MKTLAIVRSSAGSGKTYLLATEYVARVVIEPYQYRSILAVTFTNKATGEMKRRIVEELFKLASGVEGGFFDDIVAKTGLMPQVVALNAAYALKLILNDYSLFAVSTIDKFFQRIVRSFFYELGLDVNYTIEVESSSALEQAVDLTIEQSAYDERLFGLIARVTDEILDDGKTTNIARSLLGVAREIFSDKFSESVNSTEHIEVLFDKLKAHYKATIKELRNRCRQATDFMRFADLSPFDFKYQSSSFLNYFFKIEGGGAIEAYGKRFLDVATGEQTFYDSKSPKFDVIEANWSEILNFTVQVKELYDSSEKDLASFEAVARSFSRSLLLRTIRDNFLKILSADGKLPISRTAELIDRIAAMADVPFIFENLGTRYSTIYIDEFQDTSQGQWRGFFPLLEQVASSSESPRSVMLIGDVKQAIYRWRGGDWNILAYDAQQTFASFADSSTSLTTNWRSEANVVDFNNDIMASVVATADSYMQSILDRGGDSVAPLHSILRQAYADMRQSVSPSRIEDKKGYIQVDTDNQPLIWVVAQVEELLDRGYRAGDIAILTRNTAEGRNVASALVAEGIAIVSDESLSINSSDTVDFIVNILRFVYGQGDDITRAAVNRYLHRDFVAELEPAQIEFIESLKFCTPLDAAERTIRFFELQSSDSAYIEALCNEIYIYCRDNSANGLSFISAWDERLNKKSLAMSDMNSSAVRILTIHKAKGLEFKCVILPYCSWSLLPSIKTTMWVNTTVEPYCELNPILINYSSALEKSVFADEFYNETASCIVDNVNLLYVALTRACVELYLCLPLKPKNEKSPTVATLVRTALSLTDSYSLGIKAGIEDSGDAQPPILSRYDSFENRAVLAGNSI